MKGKWRAKDCKRGKRIGVRSKGKVQERGGIEENWRGKGGGLREVYIVKKGEVKEGK